MSNPVYTRRPAETLGSDALAELALDLRWSFNHAADTIWQRLDPVLWNLTHNPWVVLQTVSRERLEAVTAEGKFQQLVNDLVREKRHAEESSAWFQQAHPRAPFSALAYFSMEFMLSEALPIYSGGLGNVAGDQLKTASNLGVPVVGIGLLLTTGCARVKPDTPVSEPKIFGPGEAKLELKERLSRSKMLSERTSISRPLANLQIRRLWRRCRTRSRDTSSPSRS